VTNNAVLDPLILSEENLSRQLSKVVDGTCAKLVWRAAEVREHMRMVWRNEGRILRELFPSLFQEVSPVGFIVTALSLLHSHFQVENGYPIDALFIKLLLIEPSMYRPIRHLKGERFEHPRTSQYRKVMEADQLLEVIRITMSTENYANLEAKVGAIFIGAAFRCMISEWFQALVDKKVPGKTLAEKLHNAYMDIQIQINLLYDADAPGGPRDITAKKPGLRQLVEKKTVGIEFRTLDLSMVVISFALGYLPRFHDGEASQLRLPFGHHPRSLSRRRRSRSA
jgi:hypothetical protein